MTQARTAARPQSKESGDRSPSAARTVAEWVSLGLSALLLLGVVSLLVYEGLRDQPAFVPAQIRPLVDQARQVGDQYVVPIEVRNQGDRTLRSMEIEVTYRAANGMEETQELTLDYLGEGSTTTVYLYLDQDPAGAQIQARAAHYQSD